MSVTSSSSSAPVPTTVELAPELSAKLADPRTAEQITELLDRLDLINLLVGGVGEMAARSDAIIQAVTLNAGQAREVVDAQAAAGGVSHFDVGASLTAATQLIAALPGFSPALLRGGESGALDALTSEEMVTFLRMGAASLDDAFDGKDTVPVNGILSLNRAIRDPDIQRALSFLMTAAKALGKKLAENDTAANR